MASFGRTAVQRALHGPALFLDVLCDRCWHITARIAVKHNKEQLDPQPNPISALHPPHTPHSHRGSSTAAKPNVGAPLPTLPVPSLGSPPASATPQNPPTAPQGGWQEGSLPGGPPLPHTEPPHGGEPGPPREPPQHPRVL